MVLPYVILAGAVVLIAASVKAYTGSIALPAAASGAAGPAPPVSPVVVVPDPAPSDDKNDDQKS